MTTATKCDVTRKEIVEMFPGRKIRIRQHELRAERELFGNDKNAINRHSVRVYLVPGHSFKIYLNKTLDGSPPFYELYSFDGGTVSIHIPVKGERYFGSGLTWKQAIALAGEAIDERFAEEANN